MRTFLQLCALALPLVLGGCRSFFDDDGALGNSPLRPAASSPDSVLMEIVWARFPLSDPQLNEDAWREIDETQLDPAVRRALAENGFRAGVISGTPPAAIARALRMGETDPDELPDPGAAQSIDILAEPTVRGRVKQTRRGERTEIQASELYASLPLLVNDADGLRGRTYYDAQAVYALKVDPQPDRMVLVELTPELHFGPPRLRWTGEDAVLRTAQMRDREAFERLRMNVRLAPGEMLVLMSLPEASGRLAHYFHTSEASEGRQQKLILIRPAQVPASDTFDIAADF
jgi:hypothetical protein